VSSSYYCRRLVLLNAVALASFLKDCSSSLKCGPSYKLEIVASSLICCSFYILKEWPSFLIFARIFLIPASLLISKLVPLMDEGIERDNTSGGGGLPTLPGLYLSTIQPSQRGFHRKHVCEGEDNWRQYI
jgi:hypothetical protein